MKARQQSRSGSARMLVALAAVVALAWFLAAPAPSFAAAPAVQARSGIMVRASGASAGEVLWSKNPNARHAPASCTKIMTALLVLERYKDLSRLVRAPARVTSAQKVAIGLRPGDRITVRQALRGMLVKSANDAALTLAVAVDGSERRFVHRMNKKARHLGLTNTHYMNCRGTDQTGHYMSARDLATLGRLAMKDSRFRAIVRTKTAVITWPPSHSVTVTSHNRLLDYEWGTGIKTGATGKAGMVLVGSGTPSGVPLIVVTMHEPSRDQEEKDAVALFEWGAAQ